MSDVLKWLQNMANEEWEYEDGDYALEAIKFFNSLRAENSKSKSIIGELLDYAESLEGRLDSHDLGMLEDTDLKSRARAVLEGTPK